MEELLRRLFQDIRTRSCRLPYDADDLSERVLIATEVFRFVGLPEMELERAVLAAERSVSGKRPLNIGDVISAWLQTIPEEEINDSKLVG